MKFFIIQSPQSFRPDIFLQTRFSNTCNLCEEDSTQAFTSVLYILNFNFLDISRNVRSFWSEQQHALPDTKQRFIPWPCFCLLHVLSSIFSMIPFLIGIFLFPFSSVFRLIIVCSVLGTFTCRPISQFSTSTLVLLCSMYLYRSLLSLQLVHSIPY